MDTPLTVTSRRASVLQEELHSHCFACAPDNKHGLGLIFHVDVEGVTNATWQPSPIFQSYDGRIHGGILATLMDASMVHALFARGIAGVTGEMTVRYRVPVRLGMPVKVTTRLEAQIHGICYLRAEIWQNGDLAAKGHGKFMAMPEAVQNFHPNRQPSCQIARPC